MCIRDRSFRALKRANVKIVLPDPELGADMINPGTLIIYLYPNFFLIYEIVFHNSLNIMNYL